MKPLIDNSFAQILLGCIFIVSVLGLSVGFGFAQSAAPIQSSRPAAGVPIEQDVAPHADETTAQRDARLKCCLLYTSPSPRDQRGSRMPSSA